MRYDLFIFSPSVSVRAQGVLRPSTWATVEASSTARPKARRLWVELDLTYSSLARSPAVLRVAWVGNLPTGSNHMNLKYKPKGPSGQRVQQWSVKLDVLSSKNLVFGFWFLC